VVVPNNQVVIVNKALFVGFAPQLCFHVDGNLQQWEEVLVGGTPCSATVQRNQTGCDGPYLDARGCCLEGVSDGVYALTATFLDFASDAKKTSQTTDQLVVVVEPVAGGSCQSPNDLLDCPVQCGQAGGCQTCEACVQCCLAFSDEAKCSRICEPSCHPGVEAAPQATFTVDDMSAGLDPAVTGLSPNDVHADAGAAVQQVTA